MHQITRDNFPFSAVPVLRVKDRSAKDGKELVLGEVSAILTLLDEVLPGSVSRWCLGCRVLLMPISNRRKPCHWM